MVLCFAQTFCNFIYSKSKKFIVELFFSHSRYSICSAHSPTLCCVHLSLLLLTASCNPDFELCRAERKAEFIHSVFFLLFSSTRFAPQLQFMIGFYTKLFHNYSNGEMLSWNTYGRCEMMQTTTNANTHPINIIMPLHGHRANKPSSADKFTNFLCICCELLSVLSRWTNKQSSKK